MQCLGPAAAVKHGVLHESAPSAPHANRVTAWCDTASGAWVLHQCRRFAQHATCWLLWTLLSALPCQGVYGSGRMVEGSRAVSVLLGHLPGVELSAFHVDSPSLVRGELAAVVRRMLAGCWALLAEPPLQGRCCGAHTPMGLCSTIGLWAA